MAQKSARSELSRERSTKRRKLSPPSGQDPTSTKKSKAQVKRKKTEVSSMSIEDENETLPAPPPISVKGLDSSEPAIRRKQLNSIIEVLSARHPSQPLDLTECLALWRGFFVATYMHDSKNAVSVQNLLQQLAATFEIVHAKDQGSSLWLDAYHTAFHQTLVREWAGIDSHRMNKYLLLVRFTLRELFKICFSSLTGETEDSSKRTAEGSADGESDALKTTMSVLEVLQTAGPLNSADRKIPDGLRLHVLDLWTDEVFGTAKNLGLCTGKGVHDTTFGMILEKLKAPLLSISKGDSGAQKHVRQRAKDAMKDFDEQIQVLTEAS